MRISFRAKTVLGMTSIVSLFLLILMNNNLRVLVSSHEQELSYHAESMMDFLVAAISPELMSNDQTRMAFLSNSALQSNEVLAVRVSRSDSVVVDFKKPSFNLGETRALTIERRVPLENNTGGVVELTFDAEHLDAIASNARRQSIKIALFEIFLLSIAVFALAVFLTEQLVKLKTAISELENGQASTSLQPQLLPNDEVGDVSRAFIHLRETLHSTEQEHERLLSQASQLAIDNSQKEFWLKAIINQLAEGIIAFDEQGTIHYTNTTAQDMLGFQSQSMTGLTVFDLSLSEVQQKRIRAFIGYGPKDRTRETLTRHLNELIYRKDGSAFSAAVSLSYTRIEQTDYFILSFGEVALREQIEREMKIGDAVRTGILESSLSAIVAIDQDDKILEFNPSAEKIFGYSRQSVLNKRMSDLIMPERFRQAHRMGMAKFLSTGEGPVLSQRIEILAIDANHREFPIELAITPISSDDGHIFTAVIDDISQRIKDTERLTAAKEEADRSSQEKSRFLASMSHEIRTPLNIMLGMVDLLQGTQLNDQQRNFLVSAENSGRNLLDMINDVLDLSKIEAGKMEPNNAFFNPIKVFEETVLLFSQRCWSKGLRLFIYVGNEIPEKIFSDAAFFRQVISNLMANAVNYTDSGHINAKLYLERINGLLHLNMDVCDSGVGLSSQEQTLLFQDFSQVQQTRPKESRGTGLGLVICREMANLLGGDISLRSEVGKGSVFSLQLPIVIEPKSLNAEPIKNTCCYLLSESDSWRANLTQQLTDWGAQVVNIKIKDLIARGEHLPSDELVIVDMVSLAEKQTEQVISFVNVTEHEIPVLLMSEDQALNYDRLAKQVSTLAQPSTSERAIETIQLLLGKIEKPLSTAAEHSLSVKQDSIKRTGTILVVDDSEGNRVIAQTFLSDQGYDVIEAGDGIEAIEQVKSGHIDLVLMDMRMPNMGGVDATKVIRQQHLADSIPIIALTAHALVEVREECISVGMQDFLTKPIEREHLLKTVARWLNHKPDGGTAPSGLAKQPDLVLEPLKIFDESLIQQLVADTSEKATCKMLDVFFKECRRRQELIKQAKLDDNIEDYSVSVHALKSSAKTFGAMALSDLARAAEQACLDHKGDLAWSFVDEINNLVDVSLSEMERQLSRWWQPTLEQG